MLSSASAIVPSACQEASRRVEKVLPPAEEEEEVTTGERQQRRTGNACLHLLRQRERRRSVALAVQDQRRGVDFAEPCAAVIAARGVALVGEGVVGLRIA